ncbi:MAG: hypothetical protein PUG50_01100 [Eubacteriales bacterium]|uniref:hypothetical protein n=1 Tax=Fenollaria sp. TaxID=1965292 RepID=UPI002A74E348|nr:hypothetical protein [Fenollaria sp.]MDD7339164.1 hypothetical protein [Eubacteriales bacterium]MDY3105815.1 hypothetical protein [Fenollaria sp.]
MVLDLIKNDIEKNLDKNALLMALMAFIFTLIPVLVGQSTINNEIIMQILKSDSLVMLFIIFALELAKSTIVNDKISKRIEFILANGVSKNKIIINYIASLYFSALIILAPSIVLSLYTMSLSIYLIFNTLITSLIYTLLIIYTILFITNMNKINRLQISFAVLHIIILSVSYITYIFTNVLALYFIIKALILIVFLILLGINTKNERIVTTYY